MKLRIVVVAALACALHATDRQPLVTGIDSVGLTVSDLDRSVDFYTKVLSFEKVSEKDVDGDAYEHLEGIFGIHLRIARLRLGSESIELTEYIAPRGRPAPIDAHSNDRSFQHLAIIVSDMARAYEWLRRNKVAHASPRPQRLPDWNKNAGGIEAFYFRDPDGHPLEILHFPPDKGDPKWQRDTDRLFLGIDHTAIVISDTEASLVFYRDILGMHVAGASENYGTEQERLNNVFGARLRITAVRAASGPGIEFLQYLAPGDGRPYPVDEKPNDLIHAVVRFAAPDTGDSYGVLRNKRVRFVSSGVIALAAPSEFRKAFVIRDPDGHAIEIAQQ